MAIDKACSYLNVPGSIRSKAFIAWLPNRFPNLDVTLGESWLPKLKFGHADTLLQQSKYEVIVSEIYNFGQIKIS